MRHDREQKSIAAYRCGFISCMPARLDLIQSVTGFVLAIFIMAHLIFEASILISKDAMLTVTKFFEGYYFFGEYYPGIISFLAAAIFLILIVHALTALRKFPSSYRQYRIIISHAYYLKHADSKLWLYQVITGFIMFFLASVHLYMMMSRPDQIGPYASADRIYSEWMWPLYLILMLSVILHAFIGLYRLALKWGIFEQPGQTRRQLKKLMIISIILYTSISLMSLGTYMFIGYQHVDKVGERYQP
ncbi:MAG: fumarate reductase cytochrome b subunit [gamma proteobacterium symbiont of Taylorina sp.]|nr:fumarate reductase cytochrome b subunit [gamma proteobacterium symbiont of Taylorina sp.]